jgi:hypothetical protein
LPTGRPRSRAGCGRSAWSAACSTVGNLVCGRAPGWRRRLDGATRSDKASAGTLTAWQSRTQRCRRCTAVDLSEPVLRRGAQGGPRRPLRRPVR